NPNASENTKRLKTVSFLQDMRSQLAPGGLLAVNLIEADPSTAEDLETFQQVFPAIEVFDVPETGNLVLFALTDTSIPQKDDSHLPDQLREEIPFRELVRHKWTHSF
ncbi:MAG: hypothetical protein AAF191_15745, partial [Verrucomicrobiota bacterium]